MVDERPEVVFPEQLRDAVATRDKLRDAANARLSDGGGGSDG